jgi:hypothetical protein
VGYGLSVVQQNRWENEDGIGHTSRSSGLLEFFSLAPRLVEARCERCVWHHRGGHMQVKQKTVGLMASGAAQWMLDKNTLHEV